MLGLTDDDCDDILDGIRVNRSGHRKKKLSEFSPMIPVIYLPLALGAAYQKGASDERERQKPTTGE